MKHRNYKTGSRGNYKIIIWIAEIAFLIMITVVLSYLNVNWSITNTEFIVLEFTFVSMLILINLSEMIWQRKKDSISGEKIKKILWKEKGKYGYRKGIFLFAVMLLSGVIGIHFMQILLKNSASYGTESTSFKTKSASYETETISEDADSIPSSLLEFAEKYPEAETFVTEYPQKKDLNVKIDLTNEVVSGEIPLFIQWDERWGYKIYGSDCMGITGCGPTCISMVVCGLTGNLEWNPYEVAKYAEENGYYVDGTGTAWTLMTDGTSNFGLKASRGTVTEDYIKGNLSPSTPMIASMLPGDFTYTGHFIVLTGIDQEGNVTVNDPNSRINSEKTWPVQTLISQMSAVWCYSVE